MSMLDVIKTRRSIRRFKKEPISFEDAERVLDAARLAPSGGNKQRWKFIYINDPQVLRMIRNCSPGFYGDAASVIVIDYPALSARVFMPTDGAAALVLGDLCFLLNGDAVLPQ